MVLIYAQYNNPDKYTKCGLPQCNMRVTIALTYNYAFSHEQLISNLQAEEKHCCSSEYNSFPM